jgi:transcriptional regulator with XRE-family HTH domain
MDNITYLKQIGKRVKEVRAKKKISLRKLREISGLDISYASLMENGKHSINVLTLKRIADALKVDIKDFL